MPDEPHSRPSDLPDFLVGGGEASRLIASRDWSDSLGPIEDWPQSLRSAVGLMAHSPVPLVLLWGVDGIMLYNDAYAIFAGGRHPELLGSRVREGWPEVADFNDNVMRVGLAGGTLTYKDQELTLIRHGRPEPAWMNLDYSPVFDESGRPGGVIAIVVETTERVLAERRQAALTAKLRRQFEQAPGFVIIMTGRSHLVEFVNQAHRTVFGSDDWVGRSIRQAFPSIEGQGFFEALDQVFTTGETIQYDAVPVTFRRGPEEPVETRLLTFIYAPLQEEDGQVSGVFCEGIDVTESRRAEQALADLNNTLEQRVEERTRALLQAEEALRQAQKMEAVGQLTGGIAHDFNNLLTGVGGSLELMQKRLSEGRLETLGRYIDAAQQATRRAAALTQRLLAFSRRQTLDPRAIDANQLIAGMEDLIRRSVGPGMEVEVAQAAGLWTIRVDPSQLENTLLNLCINARDAMAGSGGLIVVETSNRTIDETEARDLDLPAGDYVCLGVADTGAGMSPDVISRAFEPFYTTKPMGEGTGLGLSMVYGFARQSGGQVRITSELGGGTMVRLFLPRFDGQAEALAVGGEAAIEPGQGEVVLVVDDEVTIRKLIVEMLTDSGYRTLEAGDGASALETLQSATRIDLLVTDVGLPGGMNGRQLADAARVARRALKVLFITGYAENAVVRDGRLEAGMAIVTKPFVIAALGARIRQLLDS